LVAQSASEASLTQYVTAATGFVANQVETRTHHTSRWATTPIRLSMWLFRIWARHVDGDRDRGLLGENVRELFGEKEKQPMLTEAPTTEPA
jgi:hypothetical protein